MATTWINRGHFYNAHVRPILVDCNFIVDSTNGNGLGIRNLKGQGVQAVYMYSTSPAAGNPVATSQGTIVVHFSDNFQRYYGGFNGFVSPLSGSNLAVTLSAAALTPGVPYVITSVGTSTAADWLALGVPPGVTPAPGVPFVAISAGVGTGSGHVQAYKSTGSGIDHIEAVGDNNLGINPIPTGPSPNVGGWLVLNCWLDTVATQPADGTVISLASYLNQSNVVVAGE